MVGGVKDEISRQYAIMLHPEFIKLCGDTQWNALNWDQRLRLRGSERLLRIWIQARVASDLEQSNRRVSTHSLRTTTSPNSRKKPEMRCYSALAHVFAGKRCQRPSCR